jgi:PPOX class probable F420-dependent enzyme
MGPMSSLTEPRTQLAPEVRSFLEAPGRFATIATINADGSPHQTVVWFLLEDDDSLIMNSAVGRRWPSNLRRDPRISLTVEAGLHYVVLRGSVTEIDDGEVAQSHIAAMARRYETPEHAEEMIANRFRGQHRVSFRLQPRSMTVHWESRS